MEEEENQPKSSLSLSNNQVDAVAPFLPLEFSRGWAGGGGRGGKRSGRRRVRTNFPRKEEEEGSRIFPSPPHPSGKLTARLAPAQRRKGMKFDKGIKKEKVSC